MSGCADVTTGAGRYGSLESAQTPGRWTRGSISSLTILMCVSAAGADRVNAAVLMPHPATEGTLRDRLQPQDGTAIPYAVPLVGVGGPLTSVRDASGLVEALNASTADTNDRLVGEPRNDEDQP